MVTLLSMTSVADNTLYFILVFVGLAFQGVGLGLFATPATGAAINAAPPDKAGVAGGIFKMANSLGGALGIAIHLAIYGAVAASTQGNLHVAAMYSIGSGVIATLLAALVAFLLIPVKK